MGRYGPPPRGRIVNPRKLKTPVEITPASQLAPYYRGNITDALIDAKLQSDRLYASMDDIDPNSDIRQMFPPIDYSRYGDEVTAMPINPKDDTFTGMAVSGYEPGSIIGLQDIPEGDGLPLDIMPAPDQQPAILMNSDPMIPPDLRSPGHENTHTPFARAESLEKPLTDFVTGFTDDPTPERSGWLLDSHALGEQLFGPDGSPRFRMPEQDDTGMAGQRMADLIAERSSPRAIDQTLGQIRRRLGGGESAAPYDQAQKLIQQAVESANQQAMQNPMLYQQNAFSQQLGAVDAPLDNPTLFQTGLIEPTTGLPVQDLIALGLLDEKYKNFLPSRYGGLPSIGGAMAGMGMGSQGNQQGIDPRSTMGPLSGLMQ